MNRWFILTLFALGLNQAACTSVQYNHADCGALPSDTFWSGNVAMQCQEYRRLQAETAYRAEVAELLRKYHACVQQHGSPAEAKERCFVYTQAFDASSVSSRSTK